MIRRNYQTAKRVFVNIRNQPSKTRPASRISDRQAPRPPVHPQPSLFTRRPKQPVRCHTPDQGGGKPMGSLSKFPVLPKSQNCPPSIPKQLVSRPFFKPNQEETQSILVSSPEDSFCVPYELWNQKQIRRKSPSELRNEIINTSLEFKKVDLRPGSFSRKWIVATDQSLDKEKLPFWPWEKVQRRSLRTPSPSVLRTRSKFQQLSSRFKLKKEEVVQQMMKQPTTRRTKSEYTSAEKENTVRTFTPELVECPYQGFLTALKEISKPMTNRRGPVRVIRM